jgi:hypothetical protein
VIEEAHSPPYLHLMKTFFLSCILIACSLSVTGQTDPNLELKTMAFTVGKWMVDVEARLSLQGPWENSKGSSTIKYALGESLLEEEFNGTRRGEPFLSKTFLAFDDQVNHFQRVFIDAPHGILMHYEGKEDNNSIVFDKILTFANGNTVTLRTSYTKTSPDSFTVISMRMPAGAAEWDVNGKMTYTRIK